MMAGQASREDDHAMSRQYGAAEQALMGGKTPSVTFPAIGDTARGVIVFPPELRQQRDFATGKPLIWEDGRPRLQVVITLDTGVVDPNIPDDDGVRSLHVKVPGQLQNEIRAAVRRAGARAPEVGAILAVTYVGDGEPSQRGLNAPKLFTVTYEPPAPDAAPDEPGF